MQAVDMRVVMDVAFNNYATLLFGMLRAFFSKVTALININQFFLNT